MGRVQVALIVAVVTTFVGNIGGAPRNEKPSFVPGAKGHFFNGKAGRVMQSAYFFNEHTNEWGIANGTCPQVAEGATLLTIETQEEWNHLLQTVLNPHGPAQDYWTSAEHIDGRWQWPSGIPIDNSWAPWRPPHPTNPIISKVAVHYNGTQRGDWITVFYSEHIRYICELNSEPDPSVPQPCPQTNDMVVLLDASGSIGEDNYKVAKDFVAELVGAFNDHAESRQGFATFSTNVSIPLPLNHAYTPTVVDAIIRGEGYSAGETNTSLGISSVRDQFRDHGKLGVPWIILVLTDGVSSDPEETERQAIAARAEGITTYSLGIGTAVDEIELLAVAGDSSRMFRAPGFEQLLAHLREVSEGICQWIFDNVNT